VKSKVAIMLEQSKLWIELLAVGVEIAAAIVIGLAALEAIVRALPLFLRYLAGGEGLYTARARTVAGAGTRIGAGLPRVGGKSASLRPSRRCEPP
jgi:hypothetical protein